MYIHLLTLYINLIKKQKMKRSLYVSPAVKEYGISLENGILQGSQIDPEVSIDDMNVGNVNNW